MIDSGTQLVELLRPKMPHPCKHIFAQGNWAIGFPNERLRAVFGIVAEGSCWFEYPGEIARPLQAGDFILLISPQPWMLRNGNPCELTDFSDARDRTTTPVISFGKRRRKPGTRIVGGFFEFDAASSHLLLQLLPSTLIVKREEERAWRLRSVVELIIDQALSVERDEHSIARHLLHVLLLETLRFRADATTPSENGLLAGLADTRIATALRALHANVRYPWNIKLLARQAGMSRSAFSASFREVVGKPPIEYLLQARMALAKDALRFKKQSVDEVAAMSGYASTSAFTTAFRRTVGCSPARYSARCSE